MTEKEKYSIFIDFILNMIFTDQTSSLKRYLSFHFSVSIENSVNVLEFLDDLYVKY